MSINSPLANRSDSHSTNELNRTSPFVGRAIILKTIFLKGPFAQEQSV